MNAASETELEQGGERFRPQWHFSPQQNWINDPNGLVWFEGEYHLFFQYNPFGDQWGHMSWGHAVSIDLLHWQELPVAIPEDERVSIFSGSIVVDQHNSSGFGDDTDAVLVAIYTGCKRVPEGGQAQELAYSLDRGRTWTKYAGNPVLDIGLRDFRDPKVFWHQPTGRWVMAVVRPDDHVVSFYASHNLRQWQHLSDFGPEGEVGGIWECPDLIEFPAADGKPAHSRWLLKVDTFAGHPGGTGAQVFVGRFDGTRFTPDEPGRTHGTWADHGCDFYAALSWAHLPASHTAPVWIGWMNNHGYAKRTPTSPWRGVMSVPRELFLREAQAGTRLGQRPLPALQTLRGQPLHWPALTIQPGETLMDTGALDGRSIEIEWSVAAAASTSAAAGAASEFGLQVRSGPGEATLIGVCRRRGVLFIDRQHSGFVPSTERWAGRREVALEDVQGALTLRVLVDRCSVEVFTGDGVAVLTELVFPTDSSRALRLYALGGEVQGALTVWPLAAAQ